MTRCLICLGDVSQRETHAACARKLFGMPSVPRFEVGLAQMHTLGLAMAGSTSISGIQRKVSLGLDVDRKTLQVVLSGARYLLKPQAGAFPHLPENEHVTMQIAAEFGLQVPPNGLLRLVDGSLAYIVERFDRPRTGGKRRQEDFCQLAERSPKQKYEGSAELCVRLVRKYAAEPGPAVLALFRQLLFGWWTGNGDMHLKNLSVLADAEGRHALSPAYDLLNTRLVIPDDPMALTLDGKRDRLTRQNWLSFGHYARLPKSAAERVLAAPTHTLVRARELCQRSYLPDEAKARFEALLEERAALLAGSTQR